MNKRVKSQSSIAISKQNASTEPPKNLVIQLPFYLYEKRRYAF